MKEFNWLVEVYNFEKMEGISGLKYMDDERTIEIVEIGENRYYIRFEYSIRFDTRCDYKMFNTQEVVDFVVDELGYIGHDDDE